MKKNMNPNSLKNLKPFVRGVSGNPSGLKKIPDELVGYLKKLGDTHIIKTKEVLTGSKDEFGQDAFILEEYDPNFDYTKKKSSLNISCLLYTSDAADE